MKKILFFIFLIVLSATPLQALEEEFKPIILEPEERVQEEVSPYTKEALRAMPTTELDSEFENFGNESIETDIYDLKYCNESCMNFDVEDDLDKIIQLFTQVETCQ